MRMTATEFKATCLAVLDRVGATGEEVLITKHGRPVARVVPHRQERPWLALRGSGAWMGDPFEPAVGVHDIDALR